MSPSRKFAMLEHIDSKEKKQTYVNQMFATIAPRYDLITKLLSYGQDQRWKERLVHMAAIEPHHQVLDLACGTGDIAFLLARSITCGQVTGVDITPGMIDIARRRRSTGLANVHFEVADIMQLSFPNHSFDRITVGYGVRNVPDIPQLLREVFRLLKPGGQFLSLDFGKPTNRFYHRVYLTYLGTVGSVLGWLLHRDPDVYGYIAESIKLYPGQDGVKRLMQEAGFVDTRIVQFLGGALAINSGGKPRAQ